ncbi:MAG TPA: histidine kinase, partial [Jatrophihabitans sp.]
RLTGYRRWWIGGGLLLAAVLDIVLTVGPSWDYSYILSLVSCVGLCVTVRWPRIGYVISIPGLIAGYALLAAAASLYVVASKTRSHRVAAAYGIPVVVGYSVTWPPSTLAHMAIHHMVLRVLYGLVFAACPIALGLLIRTRAELSHRVSELADRTEESRALAVETAISAERLRIAREMHDVVGHQVTLVAVQAATLQVLSDDPSVREVGASLRDIAQTTLNELRDTLAALRDPNPSVVTSDDDPFATNELAPAPRPEDLPQLAKRSQLPVSLQMDVGDDLSGLAPTVHRTAYRIVQEALSNAGRYAPSAPVTVAVQRNAIGLLIQIVNPRSAAGQPGRPIARLDGGGSSGLGLIGLQERIALHGGEFDAGPTDEGGWQVRAIIPVRTV